MFSMKSDAPEQQRPFLSLWPGWGMAGAWLGHGWGRWAGTAVSRPGGAGWGRNGRFIYVNVLT